MAIAPELLADGPLAEITPRTDHDTGNRWYPYPRNPAHLLTSVTTITGGTHRKYHVEKWKCAVTGQTAIANLGVLAEIAAGRAWLVSTRQTGPDAAAKWLEQTADRERDIKAEAGKYVHATAEALWLWAQTPERRGDLIALPELPPWLARVMYDDRKLPDVVAAMVDGFTRFVKDWNPRLMYAEMRVYNVELGVAGTADMILIIEDAAIERRYSRDRKTWTDVLVRRPGQRVTLVVDIKTGKYMDPTYDEQVAAYRRMTEADPTGFGDLIDMPASDGCAILHLRDDFTRGYRLRLIDRRADTEAWNTFQDAARMFTRRERNKHVGRAVYPPTAVTGEFPDVDIDGLDGYGRAPGVLVKAGIATLQELTVYTRAEIIGSKRKGQDRGVRGVGPDTADVIERMLADHGEHLAPETQTQTETGEVAA